MCIANSFVISAPWGRVQPLTCYLDTNLKSLIFLFTIFMVSQNWGCSLILVIWTFICFFKYVLFQVTSHHGNQKTMSRLAEIHRGVHWKTRHPTQHLSLLPCLSESAFFSTMRFTPLLWLQLNINEMGSALLFHVKVPHLNLLGHARAPLKAIFSLKKTVFLISNLHSLVW